MMEQLPENSAGQGDSPAPAVAVLLGKTLREARERLGLSVADVSGQTKLAPRQIEALEAEDFRNLPEMPFVRGFVRSYAKILQLDAQPLLASLPQASADTVRLVPASVEAPFPVASSPQRQNLIWLGAALLLSVLVVALAVWNFTTPPAKPGAAQVEAPVALPEEMQVIPASPVAEAIVPPAAPAAKAARLSAEAVPAPAAKAARPPAEAAPAPAAKAATPPAAQQAQAEKPAAQPEIPLQSATLRLTFGEESWTEIRGKDDKILSSQVNLPGSELRLKGQGPFSLVVGRASSARLYYRGKQVDLTPHINSSSDVARLTLE